MIDFPKALQLAMAHYEKEGLPDILRAYDAQDVWVIFGGKKGTPQYGGSGVSIDKATGVVKRFLLPSRENFALLDKAIELKL